MLPLLKFSSNQREYTTREAIEALANMFSLSQEERGELLPSGQESRFDNRVGWARTYLKQAGLLEYPKRGYVRITTRGLALLKQNPSLINMKSLEQFPEYIEFKRRTKERTSNNDPEIISEQTPKEALEANYQSLRAALAQELIDAIRQSSPSFFERLVVELLVKMGYGGSLKDAGQVVGRSGDEGIDGVIKEDKLGLDVIYVQAKRWEKPVGRPDIQKFVGALVGQGAKKGIFITNSTFSTEARNYVARIESRIVLIDGEQLAQLMIDYNVGVSSDVVFELKKIDSSFFTE